MVEVQELEQEKQLGEVEEEVVVLNRVADLQQQVGPAELPRSWHSW